MADWNLQATWEQAYSIAIGKPGQLGWPPDPQNRIVSYLDGRVFADQLRRRDVGEGELSHFRHRFTKLGGVPAFTPSTDVLVVGCGFGWLLEMFIEVGANNAWGTDIASIIHTEISDPQKGVTQEVQDRVLNIDIQDPQATTLFQNAGAGTNAGEFRWIVTEDVLTTMDIPDPLNPPQAMIDFLDACDNLRAPGQGGVAHFVTTYDDFPITPENPDREIIPNPLTFAEWVSVRPAHWWIQVNGDQIGGGQ
jgi:hypothetical protein